MCNEASKAYALSQSLAQLDSKDILDSDVGDLVSGLLSDVANEQRCSAIPVADSVSRVGSADSLILKEASLLSNVLKTRMLNYLEEQSEVRYSSSEDGDEIDDLRVADLIFGETEIYRERNAIDMTYDTSVHILLDRSSSMTNRIHDACVATLGIVLTLDQLEGITCTATAFPEGKNDVLSLADGNNVKMQSSLFRTGVSGSTPMASAMWQALQTMYLTDHSRKVLIIITDGVPNPNQLQHTKELIKECGESGVEVVGVGIGSQCNVSSLFPNAVEVSTVGQLSHALFEELQKLLAIRTV